MFIDETGREGVKYLDKNGVKTVETTIIVLQRQEKVIHENSSTKTISKIIKYNERIRNENASEVEEIRQI